MNIYVVVEGDVTEKLVYSRWVPYANGDLVEVAHPTEVVHNNFVIVSGQGYPQYRARIERAAQDVQRIRAFDRLVIAVDSEDKTFPEKYAEIDGIVRATRLAKDYRIVIQHFCFEAWALGNRRIARRNSRDTALRQYRAFHDVVALDPELLPDYPPEELTRTRFALKYFKALLRDRSPALRYSKSNPGPVQEQDYFEALIERLNASRHIPSFKAFLNAFV
jgi:hypothetical protein